MSDAKDPLRYFRVEARDIAEQLGRGVLQLEKAGSPDVVARLLRLAHTLKGAAGVVKQRAIAEQAHLLEDVLAPHRNTTTAVPAADIEAILKHVDAIASRAAELNAPQPVADTIMPRTGASDDAATTIRPEVAEMDALLDGISEASVRLRGLGATVDLAARARRLSERLAERAAAIPSGAGAGAGAGAVAALAGELRDTSAALERALAGGLDLAERELQQARTAAERLRLLPCSVMLAGLERAARDIAQTSGKKIVFETRGGDVRLDADVLNIVRRALVQMVRNAVVHGIETIEARRRAGKIEAGHVELEISRRGNRVAFICRDDGGGIDLEAVRRAARASGIAADAIDRSNPEELLRLLFKGGVSTAGTVTEHSGRGVGLDVVREAADRLGGQVSAQGRAGQGTAIEIMVPVSLSSMEALLLEADGAVAGIPLLAVQSTLRLEPSDIVRTADGECIVHDGRMIAFASLSNLLTGSHGPRHSAATRTAVLIGTASTAIALGVDRLRGVAEIVVEPVPALAFSDSMVSGLSLDAEGVPRIVLDADGLLAAVLRAKNAAQAPEPAPLLPILVIDDSLTTRVLEQSILESAGYAVELATSAEEGLEKARQTRYGLFLVDVEMPGMDGFTFVETIRADSALREVPAVLVTSRNAPEDRQRGHSAGANAYVVKSEFDQNKVLSTIRKLLEPA